MAYAGVPIDNPFQMNGSGNAGKRVAYVGFPLVYARVRKRNASPGDKCSWSLGNCSWKFKMEKMLTQCSSMIVGLSGDFVKRGQKQNA